MGPVIGAQKLDILIFGKSKMTNSDHIVPQRKKFCLIGLQLKCFQIFVLGSTPGELWPKNYFLGNWPFEGSWKEILPFHIQFLAKQRLFWWFWYWTPLNVHRREYEPVFIQIGCSGEYLGRGAESPPPHSGRLLRAIANKVKKIINSMVMKKIPYWLLCHGGRGVVKTPQFAEN